MSNTQPQLARWPATAARPRRWRCPRQPGRRRHAGEHVRLHRHHGPARHHQAAGTGCDIGAYELVQTGNGTPSVPTGLTATGTTSSSVSLSWNPSTGNPTGYTVYRDGKSVGTTGGPNATTFTDNTVSPSSYYTYTVDAFSGSNHSAQSSPVQTTTPAPGGTTAVQAARYRRPRRSPAPRSPFPPGARRGPARRLVRAIQLLRAGHVSDSVNGTWTRSSASTTFERQRRPRAVLPAELGRGPVRPDHHDHGPHRDVPGRSRRRLQWRGHGRRPGSSLGGQGQQHHARLRVHRGGGRGRAGRRRHHHRRGARNRDTWIVAGPELHLAGADQRRSADAEDILSSAAGAQDARATFSTAADWYAVVATFHAFASGDTQRPSVPIVCTVPRTPQHSGQQARTPRPSSTGTLANYAVYATASRSAPRTPAPPRSPTGPYQRPRRIPTPSTPSTPRQPARFRPRRRWQMTTPATPPAARSRDGRR